MPDPLIFDSKSPRFQLPLLFAGQAQKEVFVNEAHALTDALLHCAIEGESNTPPSVPLDGTNWLVGTNPSGAWAGQAGKLACYQLGNWLFVAPRDGLRLFDRSNGKERLYFGAWQTPAAPAAPSGGAVVDVQARAAISSLISALQSAGVF